MRYEEEKKFKGMQSLVKRKFEELENLEDASVSEDEWERPEGGGGTTYVISNGNFFDNCAVNFSSIYGKDLPSTCLLYTSPSPRD